MTVSKTRMGRARYTEFMTLPFNLPNFAAFIALTRTNSTGDTLADFGGGDLLVIYGVANTALTQVDVLV